MATFANIVLPDAQGTPVNHTFVAVSRNTEVAVWEDRSLGFPLGYARIRLTSEPVKGADPIRVKLALKVPKAEIISGSSASGFTPAPRVAYENAAAINFTFNQRGVTMDRADVLKYISGLFANTQVVDAIVNQLHPG